MIRKRFPSERRRRILGWTSVAIAWATALVARGIAAPDAGAAAPPPPIEPTAATTTTTAVTLPTLPADGLVVLRYTPAPTPPPEVRHVVVRRAAPAAPAPVVTSSGS